MCTEYITYKWKILIGTFQQIQHHCTNVHFKIQFFQTLLIGQTELTWRNTNSINRKQNLNPVAFL